MWDKKGENLTYKFLKLLTEQDRPKLAVIVGDSQTAFSGGALEKKLESGGYEVVRNFKAGENTAKTISRLRKINPKSPVDLVVVFTGGNNPSETFSADKTEELINTIRQKYGNPQIIFGVAPPATKGNPASIKKVFGRESHSEDYAAKRDRMAQAIADKAASMGVAAIDPRSFMLDPSSITTGDGIHLRGELAEEFANAIVSQVDQDLVNIPTPSKTSRTFTGARLSTSELTKLNADQLAKYASSRSRVCRRLGYITIGSEGERVEDLQKSLETMGYDITDELGEFGENTLANIFALQQDANIRTDGCVGPETLRSVEKETTSDLSDQFFGIRQFKPGSSEALELFGKAARYLGLPEEFGTSDDLQYILDRESKGIVGKPNYTFGESHKNKNANEWAGIWDRLRKGEIWTRSTATGLGQLLSRNAKRYYPDGLQGIGDAFNEAVGMLSYIRKRYGSPEVARSVYGKKATYKHGITGRTRRKGFKEGY